MSIIELQRRMRQLGEIRIGRVVDTGKTSQKTGRPIMRPEKLDRFRLTSASRPLLEEVAALYGGAVQPWTPANGGPGEWEVFTDADRLPVLVPPRDPVTQWYELYKGSVCVRRCDGVTEQKSDQPCMCNPDARTCQITTRLNVMLRDVPGLGVWLLTTHGYYAGTELPEVAEFLAATRGYVDAWLAMEEKQVSLIDDESGQPTGKMARFMVPKLDVAITPAQLLAGQGVVSPAAVSAGERRAVAGNGPAAVTSNEQAAIEASAKPTAEGFLVRARAVTTFAEFKVIWDEAAAAGISPTPAQSDEMTSIGKRLQVAPATAVPAAPPSANADALWQQIVAAWPGTTSELTIAFAQTMGGLAADMAPAADLDTFLTKLRAGELSESGGAL
jgi:hypothetical protein